MNAVLRHRVDRRPSISVRRRPRELPDSSWALGRLCTSRKSAGWSCNDALLPANRQHRYNDNNRNNNNNNTVNISSGEFRTISLGIHAELAKLRTALMLSTIEKQPPGVVQLQQQARKPPPQKDAALDIARQITNLEPEPLFVTVGNNGCDMIERLLKDIGWKKQPDKYSDDFKLKWVELKSAINYDSFREGEQMVNRIPNCYVLTNKLGLLMSLQRYEQVLIALRLSRVVKLKMSDFVPDTYRLDDSFEQRAFFEAFAPGDIWICKPTGLNQGRGIFLIRDLEEFRSTYLEQDLPDIGRRPRHVADRIVQRYIASPLLLEGKKFDLRVYMLVASTSPFVVLYRKGYVRLCIGDYQTDTDVMAAHLTNQFIQRKESSYADCKENTVWTFERLNQYVNNNLVSTKGVEVDWVFRTLTNRMKNIMLYCFFSVKHRLKSRIGYFDLYGFDFLVDENMKIWLIEVNANPCLATNCQVLKAVVPTVVQEALCLSIECFEKSRRGVPLLPLQTLVDYQLLYCGKQTPHHTSTKTADTTSQQLWPIGQNSEASDGNDDDGFARRPEVSIFRDDVVASVRLGDPYGPVNAGRSGGGAKPTSMFDVPGGDVRASSTATMTTGDAGKDDDRSPAASAGSMSDEARAAMMDVAGYTPSTIVAADTPPSTRARPGPSSKPPPPPRVSFAAADDDDVRAGRPYASRPATDEAAEGRGDARPPLYPALQGDASAKTLLDYYSARAAERRSELTARQRQYDQPRVTLGFFPSHGNDADQTSTSPGTPSPTPAPTQQPSRAAQSAADRLPVPTAESGSRRPPTAAAGGERGVTATTKPATTMASTGGTAAAAEHWSPGGGRSHDQKPADRKLSEPLWLTNSEMRVRGETSSWFGGRLNAFSGAATNVFLSSILSQVNPAPETEKDWGHFTLVKPAGHGKANPASKATVRSTIAPRVSKKSENR